MMYSTRFKDRVFLISGAARGIGRALATRVVAEGGKVLIGDLRHEVPNTPKPRTNEIFGYFSKSYLYHSKDQIDKWLSSVSK